MKKILALFILMSFGCLAFGQCRKFTEEHAVDKLDDNYILTGRYHTFIMTEGEQIMIFKTLGKGISYRFIVAADEPLPQEVVLLIKDMNDKVIYDNRKHNFDQVFDLYSDKPQRIKIFIKIPPRHNPPAQGCVSLVMGMKRQ